MQLLFWSLPQDFALEISCNPLQSWSDPSDKTGDFFAHLYFNKDEYNLIFFWLIMKTIYTYEARCFTFDWVLNTKVYFNWTHYLYTLRRCHAISLEFKVSTLTYIFTCSRDENPPLIPSTAAKILSDVKQCNNDAGWNKLWF